jgi:hypothetical protein
MTPAFACLGLPALLKIQLRSRCGRRTDVDATFDPRACQWGVSLPGELARWVENLGPAPDNEVWGRSLGPAPDSQGWAGGAAERTTSKQVRLEELFTFPTPPRRTPFFSLFCPDPGFIASQGGNQCPFIHVRSDKV